MPAAAAGWYALWRPVADRGMAFIAFVLFLPLLVVAAVLIKLTSRGPALYRQTRTGKDGTPFTLYKLRTMYDNSEAETGAVWSACGDRRVTPVGRVLQRATPRRAAAADQRAARRDEPDRPAAGAAGDRRVPPAAD